MPSAKSFNINHVEDITYKKNKQENFASISLMNYLSPNRSKFKMTFKLIIFSLAILCLVFALVNPKIGTQLETVKREGVDIVFISTSYPEVLNDAISITKKGAKIIIDQ